MFVLVFQLDVTLGATFMPSRLRGFSNIQNFINLHKTSTNLHQTSPKFTNFTNFTKLHKPSLKLHHTSTNFTNLHQTSQNFTNMTPNPKYTPLFFFLEVNVKNLKPGKKLTTCVSDYIFFSIHLY